MGLDLSFVPHLFLMEPFLDGALEEQVLCYWLSSVFPWSWLQDTVCSVPEACMFWRPVIWCICPAAGGGARAPHGRAGDRAGRDARHEGWGSSRQWRLH